MIIEPNCDMPWEIYLDWLSDQGNDDLREINFYYLIGDYHRFSYENGAGGTMLVRGHSMGTDYCYRGDGSSVGAISDGYGCCLGGEENGNGQ